MPSTALIRRVGSALAIVALAASVAACSSDPVSEQYLAGDNKGYIAGDFRVDEIPADDRGDPVEWAGETEHGEPLSSDDTAGKVTVVNFWYASCGPCIVEAPDLEQVWQEHQGDDVAFVGVNIYDQADTARSFATENEVTYPSIVDVDTGSVKLAFAAATPIQATPTTLVLDREGRVAARIIGQLEGASILSTLVSETLDETA
ncbi:TlpA family protein disulfide reductase [Microbacterium karelineae]|uniref:TlpA family protein disulfide reductase n=1 Tax=Microbacterium karelineae TaxID=2654283 RepID=UPI001E2BB0D9|nr:TlpA disulfide reductase family protein [Microbacterium karelineae]